MGPTSPGSASLHRARPGPCPLSALSLVALAIVVLAAAAAPARQIDPAKEPLAPRLTDPRPPVPHRDDPPETLWIFDADFEDLTGDNAGWQSHDMSSFPGQTNYWHKDTIRINGFPHLGDSTWWCGTYHEWWAQPRGYGNNWIQHLYREFPLSEWSDPGDAVRFEWDQRLAMECHYDYGYIDVSGDHGASWTTLSSFTNFGYPGKPGPSSDWDHVVHGHTDLALPAEFAGNDVFVRFRFESDEAYSSQDEHDNGPPNHSVLDGAWQLDNFKLSVNGDVVWYDDCESPGDNGWIHDDLPLAGQTGTVFQRTYEPDTQRGLTCGPGTGWMMAAVDPSTGRMVDGQNSMLISPPINVAGIHSLVIRCDVWYDHPSQSEDWVWPASGFWWALGESHTNAGLDRNANFDHGYDARQWGERIGRYLEDPCWTTITRDLRWWSGTKDWVSLAWFLTGEDPFPIGQQPTGVFLDRVRVGVPGHDPATYWVFPGAWGFEDAFSVGEADGQVAGVDIIDDDGVAFVRLVASNDGGDVWHSIMMSDGIGYYPWASIPLRDLHIAGACINYYFEATDALGNVETLPEDAPESSFEYSILPIHGSADDPGILVVGKRWWPESGDDRASRYPSDRYVSTSLDILGYEHDVFNAPPQEEGPVDPSGPAHPAAYSSYDTHIWVLGDMDSRTLTAQDQGNLINWLSGSTLEAPRNLLIVGNDVGHDLIEQGNDVTGFFTDWLVAGFVERHPGRFFVDDPDTSIRVCDAGLGFMTHDDRECWLRTACPDLQLLDVVHALPGSGASRILEYVNGLGETRAAGVARTDSVLGYRVVYLPFDIALMNEGLNGVNGHYLNGIEDRVDLLANIMEYFGKAPGGPGTGVSDTHAHMNRLASAYPNPFNPSTSIEYTVATPSRVTIRVYDLAGRAVRTLVDERVEAGDHAVAWDGRTDGGDRAASGVYFVRMDAQGGFRSGRKIVLLK